VELCLIPTGDEFEKQMQKFVKEDDLELQEYIGKVAALPAFDMDDDSHNFISLDAEW
jgi:hypothetical protein